MLVLLFQRQADCAIGIIAGGKRSIVSVLLFQRQAELCYRDNCRRKGKHCVSAIISEAGRIVL